MTGALVSGLVAGYGIAVPVGAVGAYLVAVTARTGLKVGACAALGVAAADGAYALGAALGGAALVPFLQPVTVPLRWAAAFVLVGLAVWSGAGAITRYRRDRSDPGRVQQALTGGRAFLGFLGITLMNPVTVVYFTALVLATRTASDPTRLEQLLFVGGAFVASASWQLLLAGGGALLGKALTGRRGRLVTALSSSTLIVVLAVHLLLTAGER
ncbi:LysE family transporter [Streptomyces sp. MUM 203J]|uniref:LysE family transporter n=1 Tax=Streptomyces sp. MUM 203J TaxID=2791990 RepID=UPI001F047038|nr:LysE family transporter [Streptomyces sp. MUM 203J]MCH0538798.1 LysE family transporter [Streptomyces sp. MUM 203J]